MPAEPAEAHAPRRRIIARRRTQADHVAVAGRAAERSERRCCGFGARICPRPREGGVLFGFGRRWGGLEKRAVTRQREHNGGGEGRGERPSPLLSCLLPCAAGEGGLLNSGPACGRGGGGLKVTRFSGRARGGVPIRPPGPENARLHTNGAAPARPRCAGPCARRAKTPVSRENSPPSDSKWFRFAFSTRTTAVATRAARSAARAFSESGEQDAESPP